MNANDLIGRYIQLRDHVAKRSAEHAEELAPYVAGMKAIEDAGAAMLIAQGGDEGKANIVTPAGTMYRKKWLAVKMADRPTFMAWVSNDWPVRQAFLTSAVTKSEVTDFIETTKTKPPGIDVSDGYNVLFNRPKG